jgi:putative ABC transport system permease protein
MDGGVVIEGQPLSPESSRRNPIVNWESATPDYFRAIGTRLVRGRTFDARDVADAPLVVVVSEGLAARLWPGQDPLGKRLLTHGSPEGPVPVWQTVVGVVADARYREIQTARYDVFLPHRQAPNNVQHYMIRVSGDPLAFVPSLKAVLGRIDPEVTIGGASKMEDVVGRTMSPWRFSTVVFTVFSVMALMFAAVGLAALIAYAVTQRRREIGVRMALGARAADVVRLLVAEGVWITAAGLAIGIPGAWLVTRSLSSLLFGVSPDDALTYAAVTCVLAGVSILAAYLPARKAAAVDPMTALREGN